MLSDFPDIASETIILIVSNFGNQIGLPPD
jgi:hypothetical protein